MMLSKRWLQLVAMVCALFISQQVTAINSQVPQTLEQLKQQLSQTDFVTTDFVQERQLKILKKPLVSKGAMTYAKRGGICWQLASPVPAAILLTQTQVSMSDAAGETTIQKSNPVMRLFTNLFFSVFSGDLDALYNQFEVDWILLNEDQWSLTLTPKNDDVASIAAKYVIYGSQFVDRVSLQQLNGDSTVLLFRNPNFSKPSLELACELNRGQD